MLADTKKKRKEEEKEEEVVEEKKGWRRKKDREGKREDGNSKSLIEVERGSSLYKDS